MAPAGGLDLGLIRRLQCLLRLTVVKNRERVMSVTPDKTIDCKGLSCPEPILMTKMGINQLKSGQVLEVIATDPGSVNDMTAWSKRTGNPVLESKQDGGVYQFFIKKA